MHRLRVAVAFILVVAAVATLAEAGSTAAPPPGSWQRLPPAPIAPDSGLTSVWTGREMLVFGVATKRAQDGAVLESLNVAAAYSPTTKAWRRLPSGGRAGTFPPYQSVWTGTEMLVWGQGTRMAFNPRTNRWRTLPGSPLLAIHEGHGLVVWTGREMIGWGGGCCGDAFSDGVAYDPATDRWRTLPRGPLAGSQQPLGAWTGRELVIFVGGLDPNGKPWRAGLARAAAYNPATNSWRRIAPLPEPRGGATAVWDGSEVLVAGGAGAPHEGRPAPPATVGFAYNPATNRWRRLPPMESGRANAAMSWTGSRLLIWGGQAGVPGSTPIVSPPHGLAYDAKANRWSPLPQAPLLGRLGPTAVWTGRYFVIWGGDKPSCRPGGQCTTRHFHDGAAFRPG